MRLAFTPLAEQDLEAISDYIAVDNPVRALSFVRDLRAQFNASPSTHPAIACVRSWATAFDPARTATTSSSSKPILMGC
ncbi:MAG: type II toxin-antitoxin system RelE/ParE family toxin [Burkholderiaceae bacterium]